MRRRNRRRCAFSSGHGLVCIFFPCSFGRVLVFTIKWDFDPRNLFLFAWWKDEFTSFCGKEKRMLAFWFPFPPCPLLFPKWNPSRWRGIWLSTVSRHRKAANRWTPPFFFFFLIYTQSQDAPHFRHNFFSSTHNIFSLLKPLSTPNQSLDISSISSSSLLSNLLLLLLILFILPL